MAEWLLRVMWRCECQTPSKVLWIGEKKKNSFQSADHFLLERRCHPLPTAERLRLAFALHMSVLRNSFLRLRAVALWFAFGLSFALPPEPFRCSDLLEQA